MYKINRTRSFAALFFLLVTVLSARSEESMALSEKRKEVMKKFKVSLSDKMDISNRYGNITVTHWDRNEIEIRVVVEAKANLDRRAEELLDYVTIELDKRANIVYGNTTMQNFNGTRNQERLTVNYYISKPSKVSSSLMQQYGNINLPEHNDGATYLEVKYGNINAGSFSDKLDINSRYGNVIIRDVETVNMDLSYCGEVKVGSAKRIAMESRYSNSNVKEVKELMLELRYGNFDVSSLENAAIESKYSNVMIKELIRKLEVETAYGSVDIRQVSNAFEGLRAEARYGNLNVSLPKNMEFNVDARQMKYGSYSISDNFKVNTSRTDEDNVSFQSKVNGGNSRRVIYFEGNRYSNLKIGVK